MNHSHHHRTPAAASGRMPSPQVRRRNPVYMGLPDERFLRPRFWVALTLSLPVLVLAVGEMIWPHLFHRITRRMSGILQLLLMTAAEGLPP